jgi:hypothetical protein
MPEENLRHFFGSFVRRLRLAGNIPVYYAVIPALALTMLGQAPAGIHVDSVVLKKRIPAFAGITFSAGLKKNRRPVESNSLEYEYIKTFLLVQFGILNSYWTVQVCLFCNLLLLLYILISCFFVICRSNMTGILLAMIDLYGIS